MQTQLPPRPTPPGPPPNCTPGLFGGDACRALIQQYNQSVNNYNQALVEWQHQAGQVAVDQTAQAAKERIQKIEQDHAQAIQTLVQGHKIELQQAQTTGEIYGVSWTLVAVAVIFLAWRMVNRIRASNRLKLQKAVEEAIKQKAASTSEK
jgi:hypothetical protein